QLAGRDGQHTFGKAKLGWVMHCMTANDGTSMTRLPEARGHPTKEFLRFLSIVQGSAFETQSMCHVLVGAGFIDRQEFQELYDKAGATIRLIIGFSKYLREYEAQNNSKLESAKSKG
ncbi:MAG: four helix bundle protein, partial [Planctomycetes bacterium]|nr:four helix bundle protein [Planctomycetota bacterium]